MNVYVTLHTAFFLRQQYEAICRYVPGATLHLVATGNASADIKQAAAFCLPQMTTALLVPEVLRRVAPGPGMLLEWDIVPVRPIATGNAVNVEPSAYGIHPSVMTWEDPAAINLDYMPGQPPFVSDNWRPLHQIPMQDGCGAACHFRTIDNGGFLHFHHWAAGQRPFGLSRQRVECWNALVDSNARPGLGDMVAAGLSAIGITKERVSALAGGDCGCAKRQAALNELGRRIGIG